MDSPIGPIRTEAAPESQRTMVRIELRPRCSLTRAEANRFFAIVCAVSLVSSGSAAALGAWPALVFAALVLGALRWALECSFARARDSEIIEVTEQHVRLIRRTAKRCTESSFLRHWTRITLQPGASPLIPARLLVECSGQRCEMGTFLTEAERLLLAVRLRRLIGGTAQSPPLGEDVSSASAALPVRDLP